MKPVITDAENDSVVASKGVGTKGIGDEPARGRLVKCETRILAGEYREKHRGNNMLGFR